MRLIWWMASVSAISLVSIVLSHRGTLDPVNNLSLTITAPLSSGLRDIAEPADDLLAGILDRGDLARENEELRARVEELEVELAQQQDLEQRVRELEDALGIKQGRPEDTLLAANVIAEDPSGLKRAIAIDRGLSDGVDEGMVVLSRSGSLVGTVSRASQDFAWVLLVTDPDSSINAQVNTILPATPPSPVPSPGAQSSPSPTPSATTADLAVRGVANGDLRDGVILDLLPAGSAIAEGSHVLTSGLGGNYPRGLLIGSIKRVEQRSQSPFTHATIEPAASLGSLDTVLVLISFSPARLDAP